MRLLDATTDFHVWGDTYDGEANDLLGLQDRVTEGIMRAILPHIHGAEIERVRRKQPRDLNAYELTIRAFPFVFASNPHAAVQALDLLNRSIELIRTTPPRRLLPPGAMRNWFCTIARPHQSRSRCARSCLATAQASSTLTIPSCSPRDAPSIQCPGNWTMPSHLSTGFSRLSRRSSGAGNAAAG